MDTSSIVTAVIMAVLVAVFVPMLKKDALRRQNDRLRRRQSSNVGGSTNPPNAPTESTASAEPPQNT